MFPTGTQYLVLGESLIGLGEVKVSVACELVTACEPRSPTGAPGIELPSENIRSAATPKSEAPCTRERVTEVTVQRFESVVKEDAAHAPGEKLINSAWALPSEETRTSPWEGAEIARKDNNRNFSVFGATLNLPPTVDPLNAQARQFKCYPSRLKA